MTIEEEREIMRRQYVVPLTAYERCDDTDYPVDHFVEDKSSISPGLFYESDPPGRFSLRIYPERDGGRKIRGMFPATLSSPFRAYTWIEVDKNGLFQHAEFSTSGLYRYFLGVRK